MGKLKIVILSFVGALLFVIGSSQIALSVVIYEETIDGDFSNSPGDLSNIIVLNVGTNTILGATTYYYDGTEDDSDIIKFTIPEDMSLSEIDITLDNSGDATVTNYTLSLFSYDSTSTISTWESGSPPVSNNSAFSDVLPLPPGNYAISDTGISYNNFSDGQHAALDYAIDINVTGTATVDLDLSAGWNLVSLPVTPENPNLTALFPDALIAYKFEGVYQVVTTLEPGEGYWVKLPTGGTYSISGINFTQYSTTLTPGWHLMGGVDGTATPFTTPSGQIIIMYGFEGFYSPATEFVSGKGYWVKITSECDLTVDAP